MQLDQFKDIIKHTQSLGFIDMVKLFGTDKTATLEAIDEGKSVVVYGDMYQPITDIQTTIGLSRLAQLKGFMDLHNNSTVEIVKEMRGGVSVPTELKFDDGHGDTAIYRFMSEEMINENVKVPPFKGATWDVTFKPEQERINRLSDYQGILGGFEKRFIVSTKNNTLNFSIGVGPTDRSNLPFAKDITGSLKASWSYPLSQVLSILKLNNNEDVTMHFSEMGALKIDVDSGIGKYSYILPAAKA